MGHGHCVACVQLIHYANLLDKVNHLEQILARRETAYVVFNVWCIYMTVSFYLFYLYISISRGEVNQFEFNIQIYLNKVEVFVNIVFKNNYK